MFIKIGQFDITECWDGVLYKKLSQYCTSQTICCS